MTASRPHRGPVAPHKPGRHAPPRKHPRNTHAGTYRANVPFDHNEGIQITMRAEKGITARGFLDVPFRFQCPPVGDFPRPLSVPWPVFETLSAGERSRPQGPALQQWQFTTMFMWDYEPFVVWTGTNSRQPNAVDGLFEPQLFLEELRNTAKANVIFRLVAEMPVVWGAYALIDSLATITAVAPTQKSGEIGTEHLDITFQEFREVTSGTERRPAANFTNGIYQVKTTDTLYEIARRELGKASDWRRIASVNGIRNVGPNDAAALQAWLKHHHRTTLKIPAPKPHENRKTKGKR